VRCDGIKFRPHSASIVRISGRRTFYFPKSSPSPPPTPQFSPRELAGCTGLHSSRLYGNFPVVMEWTLLPVCSPAWAWRQEEPRQLRDQIKTDRIASKNMGPKTTAALEKTNRWTLKISIRSMVIRRNKILSRSTKMTFFTDRSIHIIGGQQEYRSILSVVRMTDRIDR
jgi:hypothetical protein